MHQSQNVCVFILFCFICWFCFCLSLDSFCFLTLAGKKENGIFPLSILSSSTSIKVMITKLSEVSCWLYRDAHCSPWCALAALPLDERNSIKVPAKPGLCFSCSNTPSNMIRALHGCWPFCCSRSLSSAENVWDQQVASLMEQIHSLFVCLMNHWVTDQQWAVEAVQTERKPSHEGWHSQAPLKHCRPLGEGRRLGVYSLWFPGKLVARRGCYF